MCASRGAIGSSAMRRPCAVGRPPSSIAPSVVSRARASSTAAAGGGSRWLRKVRFDGSSELTTHPLYDARGPRTIPLDPAAARIVGLAVAGGVLAATALVVAAVFWPAILLVLVPLMQGRTRAPLRRAATRWLDARDRDARIETTDSEKPRLRGEGAASADRREESLFGGGFRGGFGIRRRGIGDARFADTQAA